MHDTINYEVSVMEEAIKKKGIAESMDMTTGSLWKKIFLFSMPLMASQILQVLFNMADIAVVGTFSSSQAMGSVGSTSILVTLFTGFLIGLGSGVNVKVAQQLGAKQEKEAKQTVHTSLIICTAAGAIITVLCLLLARQMLELIDTKDDLIDGAVLYFRIYALGMPALGIFNFGNGVLSANGDTKRPLVYLFVAGILNVILNLFFVIICGMAADGVAWASIISQYVSAILVIIHMTREKDSCGLSFRELKIYKGRAKPILMLGVPAGFQNAVFAVANLFIQAGVNTFDATMVAGNSAAANADALLYDSMAAFYTACGSFMGQNYGAGKRKRVRNSYLVSLAYSFGIGTIGGIALVIFGRQFLGLFTNDPAVVDAGMKRLTIMGFSYGFSAFMDSAIAASRALGKSVIPTVIVIIGSCIFRMVWVNTVFAHFKTIPSLYLLYIFSWGITAVVEIIYWVHVYRNTKIG